MRLQNLSTNSVEHEKSFTSTGPGLVWERAKSLSDLNCIRRIDKSVSPI